LGWREAKVLDLHTKLRSSHRLSFAPAILAFPRDAFQDDPVAFQSLYFEYAHQDTAFVPVDPPFQLIASWIALEEVLPGSGELFYYPGSHAMGDVRFANGGKAMDGNDPDAKNNSAKLEGFARNAGLQRCRYRPKRGDVLFWINDLMHGGEPIGTRHTRRSLATHYCPRGASVPYARERGLQSVPTTNGGFILAAT
jgi:ectoine hydroxylase-related dioxygenase (phytanoyl-CoA dioxygenase family)